MEERVVAVRGGLQSIPGAVGGVRAEGSGQTKTVAYGDRWHRILAGQGDPQKDLTGTTDYPRRHIDDFGNVTLILRSPADVIWHLYWTLRREEWGLLYDQLISEKLKRNYVERFREPQDALRFLQRNRAEVILLMEALPDAELTPGARMETIGPGAFRIRVAEERARQMKFSKLDVIIENGVFRLLLVE